MTQNYLNFVTKFRVKELIIHETEYWRWSIRPLQCTIGASILSLSRPAEKMLELTSEEGADLAKMSKVIESTLDKCFGQDKMNYIMLMMVDNHIHYHVVPRYSQPVDFDGKKYEDACWPKPPVLDTGKLEESELLKIRDFLKDNLVL